jgi:hypothetical protein
MREWTKNCPVFSFLQLEKKERESREQRCQSTETTISIHFRSLCRSVGVGSNSSDFFSLSLFVLAAQNTEERKKRSDRKGRCRFERIYVRIRKRKKEGR